MESGSLGLRPRIRRVVAATVVVAFVATNASAANAPDPVSECAGGWRATAPPITGGGANTLDATTVAGQFWVAGSFTAEGVKESGFASRANGDAWDDLSPDPGSPGSEVTSITPAGAHGLWAAGSTVGTQTTQPMVMRFKHEVWTTWAVPTQPMGGTLAGIASTGTSTAIAVGFAGGINGSTPLAMRLLSGRWRLASPSIGSAGAFTAVRAMPRGRAMAVGWTLGTTGVQPLAEEWTGHAWHRFTIPGANGVALSSVAVAGASLAWAAGYRTDAAGGVHPALARWNGTAWRLISPPPIHATGAILRDVRATGGELMVVGAAWNSLVGVDTHPVAALLHGGTWNVTFDPGGVAGGDLQAVASGSRLALVGRDGNKPLVLLPCSSDGAGAQSPAAEPSVPGVDRAAPVTSDDAPADPAPSAQSAGHAPAAVIGPIGSLPGLEIRDLTDAAGLTMSTRTYGALATDLNADGWQDLVIGRHGGPLWVLERTADGFAPVDGQYGRTDRHGCAAGDLDRDGQPEIVCAIGGNHGLGIRSNEVWLNPLSTIATNQAEAMGLIDPLGRGRETAVFDVNHDGYPDVLVANEPSRVDALPSTNRLFLNQAGKRLVPDPQAGLDLPIGTDCLVPADYDSDGWTDLIVCQTLPMGAYRALRVFHNQAGHFQDVTAAVGITPISDVDAAVADFNGDGRMDLVRVSHSMIEVDLQQPAGHFVKAWSASASAIRHVAVGDFEGNGQPALYVSRGLITTVLPDLLLVQISLKGQPLRFQSVALPSAPAGEEGGAVVFDFDHNGKDDILVMHGNYHMAAPIQLLAFGPPWPDPLESPPPSPSPTVAPTPVPTSVPIDAPPPTDTLAPDLP